MQAVAEIENVTVDEVATAPTGTASKRSAVLVSVAPVAAYATLHCQLINLHAVPSLPMTQLRVPALGKSIKSLKAFAVPLMYL